MRPNNFDLLRLLAALQVVYCHTTYHLEIDAGLGDPTLRYVINWFPGVPIFFTISGFLISRSWERSKNWRSYAANRKLRIYPALWTQLAIGVLLMIGLGAINVSVIRQPSFYAWLIAQSTCGQFYSAAFIRDFGWRSMNGSLWTIPVELGFYVSLPILYAIVIDRMSKLWSNLTVGMAALISFGYWYHLSTIPEPVGIVTKLQMSTPLPHLYMFLVGVMLQRNFETLRSWIENRALIWLTVFSLYMLTLNPWEEGALGSTPMTVLTGRLLLAATVISFTFSWRTLSERLLRGNDFSYGVYLYHALMIHLFDHWGLKGQSWHLVLVTVSTITLAVLSWRLVESRSLSLKSAKSTAADQSREKIAIPVTPNSFPELERRAA